MVNPRNLIFPFHVSFWILIWTMFTHIHILSDPWTIYFSTYTIFINLFKFIPTWNANFCRFVIATDTCTFWIKRKSSKTTTKPKTKDAWQNGERRVMYETYTIIMKLTSCCFLQGDPYKSSGFASMDAQDKYGAWLKFKAFTYRSV